MVFSSTVFLFLFFPLVICGYYNPWIKTRNFRNIYLLFTSLAFYGWGEPVFVFVMLFSIFVNWVLGIKVSENSKKKIYLWIAVVYNIGLLVIFKYLSFISENISLLFKKEEWVIKIALPIGISFFTFQMLSYVFDVYYGNAKAAKNIIQVGLYVSMFPQLIAGPIVRYQTVAEEIVNRIEKKEEIIQGAERFIWGLGKKVMISNYVGLIADNLFALQKQERISVASAWLGAITYTLQIYFDFSAYSDMAIGLGKMFGFHFLENFNYPYISKSIKEFWRRWHISLSQWFRDYIYIPLGGNRDGEKKTIRNIFLVWLLTGIWHGANWTFLVWGLLYFLLLMLENKTKFPEKLGWFSHIYTMFFVILAWVIFKADSLTVAIRYIGNMFGIGAVSVTDNLFFSYMKQSWIILVVAMIGATPVVKNLYNNEKIPEIIKQIGEIVAIVLVAVISVFITVKSTYNPFIYFNF